MLELTVVTEDGLMCPILGYSGHNKVKDIPLERPGNTVHVAGNFHMQLALQRQTQCLQDRWSNTSNDAFKSWYGAHGWSVLKEKGTITKLLTQGTQWCTF